MLTAGHCCTGATDGSIVAGEHSLSQVSGKEQIRDVAREHRHEQYVYLPASNGANEVVLNDVCVLTLEQPLEINE